MEFSFTGVSRIILDHSKGMNISSHVATDFFLLLSDNLKKDMYLDENELPTKEGLKPLTQTFIQGLIGCIHHGHDKGWWDSAEHIRYIIDELQRGFIEVTKTEESKF